MHLFAALAERERRIIGERTRLALQAAKARGVKLGGRNAQSDRNAAEAKRRAKELRPILAELAGLSANKAADELNRRGIATPKAARWHALTLCGCASDFEVRPAYPISYASKKEKPLAGLLDGNSEGEGLGGEHPVQSTNPYRCPKFLLRLIRAKPPRRHIGEKPSCSPVKTTKTDRAERGAAGQATRAAPRAPRKITAL